MGFTNRPGIGGFSNRALQTGAESRGRAYFWTGGDAPDGLAKKGTSTKIGDSNRSYKDTKPAFTGSIRW
jgi:hypothetical protein